MASRLAAYMNAEGRRTTFILFFVALIFRLIFVLWLHPEPAWDGVLYERAAVAIARGMGYVTYMYEHRSSDTVPTAYYPVGYPAFLALCYRLFGESRTVLHASGTLVSALTVALTHRLCWRVATPRASAITGLFVALMPGPALFAASSMTEPLWGFLLAFLLWLLTKEPRNRALGTWAVAGFTLSLATYVRPQALLLVPILPIITLYPKSSIRPVLLATLVFAVATLAPILPWTARNCRAIDGCALVSTNGGSNLAIGAVPRANGRYLQLTGDDGCRGVVGETARDRCWRAVAKASIANNPLRWVKLAAVKLDHTLSYEAFPLGYLRESHAVNLTDDQERFWRRAITGPWRLFALLSLLSLVHWKGRSRLPRTAVLCGLACVALLSTHLVFFGGDRYHLPLIAMMAPLVALSCRGIDQWWRATL